MKKLLYLFILLSFATVAFAAGGSMKVVKDTGKVEIQTIDIVTKQQEVIVPVFKEKVYEAPVIVEKTVTVEKPVFVDKEIVVENVVVKKKEVVVEVPKYVEKVIEIPVYKEVEYEKPVVKKVEVIAAAKGLQGAELGIKAETGQGLIKIDEDTSKATKEIAEIDAQTKLLIVSNTLGQLAQAVGENTVAGKALAIAQSTMNTYQGASLALATYPPPFGAIAAATVIAAGLINVKKIISTKVPAPPGTNVAGGGGGATPPQPSASIAPPQIQGLQAGGGNTGTQIAETIAESQSRPIRAYVVSQDISSKQAMDRRVNTAASL